MGKINLYSEDYVVVDAKGEPVFDLDLIYHYTTIIDDINDNGGFTLQEGQRLVSMTQLSDELQQRYLDYLRG